jgi:peptidoglycan/LPS O-acetylase OafA/YrhL
MFYSIQLLRYYAALCVVLVHTLDELNIESVGHFGVDIFFVISGFVLTVGNKKTHPVRFFYNRFVRIFPLYFLASFCFLIIKPFFFDFDVLDELWFFSKSIVFIPSFDPDIGLRSFFPVGWSLMYEMLFYFSLAVSMIFYSAKVRLFFLTLLLLSAILLDYLFGNDWSSFFGNLILGEFLLGMFVALIIQNWSDVLPSKSTSIGSLKLLILIVVLCLLFVAHLLEANRLFSFGIPAFIVVLLMVSFESFFRCQSNNSLIIFKRLGDLSYALYLTHPFVLWGLYRLLHIHELPIVLQSIIVVTIVTSVAYYVWALVEMPLARWISTFKIFSHK